ncbi:uncharacterized protein K489DRAFT_37090 [Dissoconium aciculare CBS 342.82]|uniref:Uncharacterized protein n=1 Tax=Dissoconium aciculare CBS 342.82 TaxID=1314786 RepID=A0A6J3M104_9PEZI|nr:uncharacterized protein K489DRAFT_37090 [Dissoconium aciculare CBS 342.82]KAF1820592.1 hypothetical protein K489DRAFT_37090 [Dissoconium aciculare CBS 342.82]
MNSAPSITVFQKRLILSNQHLTSRTQAYPGVRRKGDRHPPLLAWKHFRQPEVTPPDSCSGVWWPYLADAPTRRDPLISCMGGEHDRDNSKRWTRTSGAGLADESDEPDRQDEAERKKFGERLPRILNCVWPVLEICFRTRLVPKSKALQLSAPTNHPRYRDCIQPDLQVDLHKAVGRTNKNIPPRALQRREGGASVWVVRSHGRVAIAQCDQRRSNQIS